MSHLISHERKYAVQVFDQLLKGWSASWNGVPAAPHHQVPDQSAS